MISRLRGPVVALLVAIAPASAGAAGFAAQDVDPAGLSEAQAEDLLWLALRYERLVSPGDGTVIERLFSSIQKREDVWPGYFAFGASSDSPNAGATTIKGMYAISRLTGDVWEVNMCRRYRFASLRKLQRQITKRTGRSFADERAQRRRLGCTDE